MALSLLLQNYKVILETTNMKLDILYEDNHLIAVFKPVGVLTQADKSGSLNLMDKVKAYLKEKYRKPGNVFLGLLHRLDRPVSGIVLFAKTSKGASRLSEQFRNNKVEKIYHAIVFGKLKEREGRLINFIKKDKKTNKAIIYINKKEGSQRAELNYEVISSNNKYSFLKIKPKTGKFHQIRAQLSEISHPILGDIKYGALLALPDKSIALCATSLSFETPTKPSFAKATEGKKEISIPVPAFWKKFISI